MFYDPAHDISVISYINAIDYADFASCYSAMPDAAYAVREILGYPGKP